MSGLFQIPISGVKEGHHTFNFEIDNSFFESFEESEIREGSLHAITEVEKSSSHIDIVIGISGKVRVSCDRCLELFDFPMECTNRLVIKFGDERDDSDPEIITLPHDEHYLDLKQFFYEFIYLALPIQRVHPDDSSGKSTCNPFMINKLKEHLVNSETKNDPRWEELKKLINDN
jgi:uncharacterized protein